MMIVKCTANYFDKALSKSVNVGEELNVPEDRAEILVKAKVAEVVPTTPEVVTDPAPKKARSKKKAEG